MGDNTRKLMQQNPLLSAAGPGFPFDDFGPNTLLMPITPAAPEPVFHHEQQQQQQQENPQEISLQRPTEEVGNPFLFPNSSSLPASEYQIQEISTASDVTSETVNKQGYFTSILSSLPNLSLSSIRDQPQKAPSHSAGFDSSDSQHETQKTPINSIPQQQQQQQPYFTPAQFSPATTTLTADPSGPVAPPTVSLPPPSAPPPVTNPVQSYRLGNHRRLKYVPPPDLTLIPSQKITPPTITSINSPPDTFLTPDYSTSPYPTLPSSTLINNESKKCLNITENVFPNLPTDFNPSTTTISAPKEIPARNIYSELVTPNNTPADYFSSGLNFEKNSQNTEDNLNTVYSCLSGIDSLSNQSTQLPSAGGGNSETFADVDLTQSSPPFLQESNQHQHQQQQQASSAILFPSDTKADTESSLSNFFDTKNPSESVNTIPELFSNTNQESSNIPLYNPLDYSNTTTSYPGCNIDSQSAINFTSHVQTISDNDGSNIGSWSIPPAPLITSEMPEPTGTATLSPVQTSIYPLSSRIYNNNNNNSNNNNSDNNQQHQEITPPSFHSLATGTGAGIGDKKMLYRPVYHHWFYSTEVENKILWHPFSMHDSLTLEEIHNSSEITTETKVPTDGGRYDVDILKRQRLPVYWPGKPTEVKRSSWFYKGTSGSRYVPYDESVAARLEEGYKHACITEHWNRRIELNDGEYVVFHSSTVQMHYLPASSPELVASWGNTASTSGKVKVVKRGVDEFHIEEGEPKKIDHLLFLVHGIGSVCDLKFRSVEEVVDEFRDISLQLVQSHYRTAGEQGKVNRIEVLPISWHTTLHSEDTGIDKQLKSITLESIPRLRHFTNDTLLDVLFYTSPTYCQTIMQTVGNEMNRLYSLFKERNHDFNGSTYLGGHSLGSLIVFDLLCHQKAPAEEKKQETIEEDENSDDEHDTAVSSASIIKPMPRSIVKRRLSRKVSYVMGAAGTGQPFIVYPSLNFHPKAFFALGSPIGMFVTVRGIDTLGDNFRLPTCPAFFNIFHPFDPVAYRVESLVNPDAHKHRPMLIPHHKGRKRMHLELKETMARVGADLKQKLLDSVKNTWNSVYQLAMFHRADNQSLEQEIHKVVEQEMEKSPKLAQQLHNQQQGESEDEYDTEYDREPEIKVGQLNGGRRIDYVLQEAPFEYINEYIFALTSHVCYWESEDTMLMILKEIYGSNGIQADAQLPQQTMTIERQSPTSQSTVFTPSTSMTEIATTLNSIVEPTPPIRKKPVGPPPSLSPGFVRPNNMM